MYQNLRTAVAILLFVVMPIVLKLVEGCGAPTAPCIPFPFMKSTCCSGSCYWFRCRDYFWDDPNYNKDEF
ncbi:unnamed protein product [Medioppia subpectinata]|uniref:Uncharacterized protein n=1 Tax=Medioppia subpectinata TaxID=1979941 RepID=A0A7R9KVP0_9ACAR|nr:unnamed protein product [Medioppia subpectinata]CAG2109360.1 unnamed protein product [Medioppia subpectinata]